MMLEETPESTRAGNPKALPHYPMRSEFKGASYQQRYEIFCERLVRERLYDATCFLMSGAKKGKAGVYVEPNAELGIRNFAASLSARAGAFAKLRKK
jgi:hypothetical protein